MITCCRSHYMDAISALNYTVRSARGVAGLIVPWNLPLYLLTFKLAPALAYGNTVVCKPSEMTSVTSHMLCQVAKEVGECCWWYIWVRFLKLDNLKHLGFVLSHISNICAVLFLTWIQHTYIAIYFTVITNYLMACLYIAITGLHKTLLVPDLWNTLYMYYYYHYNVLIKQADFMNTCHHC